MSVIPQLEAHISHVLSQWLYRWLSLPIRKGDTFPRVEIEALAVSDWVDYIQYRLEGETAPWTSLMRSAQASPVALATLIFENIKQTQRAGAHFVDFYHPLYPALLACIKDPPNCLTVIGPEETLSKPAISVVGSRRASGFAMRETEELTAALAAEGGVIVSGGALGCDITGHRGALRSGERPCPTIVVLAGGLSRFYPRCNDNVFRLLQKSGAVFISERLWEYPARPYDFPVRNRIITGLSLRLLLMQAGERSGAKVTAQLALEQGREVFVMVHPENDVRALGSKQLLLEGATPFFSAQDYMRMAWSCESGDWFEAGLGFDRV
ncbi:MAG TPA: DNA-processing protein DprA [Oligoflexus sp.]|uniref:DNA-processing protein DprA n=1 Tax=Oligoflexus sp. TaxID=1971216 RepID=UPI002D3BD4A8|nr:DNA-processing protein DprA [Oligoflexus sp.]HYX32045.1 DNA-processing protein DprA [Oligoflexus sp.]